MTDGTGTTSYAYDSRDRLLSKSTPEGSLAYTYDTAGNRLSVRSDSGTYNVSYGYDALNRLASVTDNAPGGGKTTYGYDAASRLSSYTYPNAATTTFGYDVVNRVKTVNIGSLASYTYDFYATSNRKSVTERGGRTASWSYDHLWRLTNESIAGAAVAGSLGYAYDSVGNRLSLTSTVAGVSAQSSTYDNNDRLLSSGWDLNGNTLTDGPSQYSYDSENRLLALNGVAAKYIYDGDGQLVSKTVGGVARTYLVDDQTPAGYTQIAEERASGAVTKSYIYGSQRISMRDGIGLHYYGYDAHSGVRLLLDGGGNVTDTWDYDAFGNVIARMGTTENNFTYRGEQVDSALKLQYLRARWMDPAKGRFATRDTALRMAGALIGLHKYAYVSNDPASASDPSGHEDMADVSFGNGYNIFHSDNVPAPISRAGCKYSQEEHHFVCLNVGVVVVDTDNAYSGRNTAAGQGLNNPDAQDLAFTGPIPRGDYIIGAAFNGNLGQPQMYLTPQGETENAVPARDMFSFLIHADNAVANFTASEGCIILPLKTDRVRIGNLRAERAALAAVLRLVVTRNDWSLIP
jgi:RHS repeat-associated protein